MTRSARARHAEALDVLLRGRIAKVVRDRDWDLLEEVARLAQGDAPPDLAATDPALFQAWREAVTRFHKAGWTNMTPERVADVRRDAVRAEAAPAARTR
ncbi:MAG TPA: hypothetical protein VF601_13100 [Beijerinckiaceae bacterium]|jgi:hypothetical protein